MVEMLLQSNCELAPSEQRYSEGLLYQGYKKMNEVVILVSVCFLTYLRYGDKHFGLKTCRTVYTMWQEMAVTKSAITKQLRFWHWRKTNSLYGCWLSWTGLHSVLGNYSAHLGILFLWNLTVHHRHHNTSIQSLFNPFHVSHCISSIVHH
jgi:hypothetical protein